MLQVCHGQQRGEPWLEAWGEDEDVLQPAVEPWPGVEGCRDRLRPRELRVEKLRSKLNNAIIKTVIGITAPGYRFWLGNLLMLGFEC